MKKHITEGKLLGRQVKIALVGCGGVGAHVLSGLARLHTATVALGHPAGLDVTVFDPDTVSQANVGRQAYSPADIGINKTVLSVHRLNSFYGLNWNAEPTHFPVPRRNFAHDIVVSCVDTKAARRDIADYCRNAGISYWLDFGNDLVTGQVILGQPLHRWEEKKKRPMRLPTVTELFPEILDKNAVEDSTPSCSLQEPLSAKTCSSARAVPPSASNCPGSLFRQGGLDNHGMLVNLQSGRVTPLPVDAEIWEQLIPKKQLPNLPRRQHSIATDTGPRDLQLQEQVPTVMVPNFGEFVSFKQNGQHFLSDRTACGWRSGRIGSSGAAKQCRYAYDSLIKKSNFCMGLFQLPLRMCRMACLEHPKP